MFKKAPSKLGTKENDYKLNNGIEKVLQQYKNGMPAKEAKARKLWGKITNEGFDDDTGKPIPAKDRILKAINKEKGVIVLHAMLQLNIKNVPRRRSQKITKEEAEYVFEQLRAEKPFTFEEFKQACQLLCQPVIIFMGPPQSGKKQIFNHLTTNGFPLTDEKMRNSYIFTDISRPHPLQLVATVIVVLPLFRFKGDAASEVSKLWTYISKATEIVTDEPEATHVHFFFNWDNKELQTKVLELIPVALFAPPGEKVGDLKMNQPGPKYKYMQERIAFEITNEITGAVVVCHTVFNEPESIKEAWLDMHHASIKENPKRDIPTPPPSKSHSSASGSED